ncbi:thermonuclease family protein [Flavobacterium daejeonense]|uniref:thermonuclease family protein n=1 Tax=Flavobacterium daejeonense TaxID=350893 RepID=UPI000479816E|nr:thermonuclease family protein [Flavobacterium daejeonense]
MIKLTFFFFGLLFQLYAFSQSGKVIKIKDGDTIVVLDSLNNQITIRLAEVDCPENSQAFGNRAKQFTANEVGNKKVTYKVDSKDRYGRTIAKVFYDGKYLSEEIIKNGFGWHYKQYSISKKLAEIEILAKKNGLGLWKDKAPVPPWEFRNLKRASYY